MPLPVISVGRDRGLLSARKRLMEKSGLSVQSVSPEEAERLVRDGCSRLWVFCASVEISTLIFLASSIRRHSPESRLVLVEREAAAGIEESLFHRVMDGQASGDVLARVVQDLALAHSR